MLKIIKEIQKYVLYTLVFLYPVFFLPIFLNTFETPKLLILVLLSLIYISSKLVEFLYNKRIAFNFSKIDLPLLLLLLTYFFSGLLISTGFMDSFLNPGTSTFVIFATLLYFSINQLNEHDKEISIDVFISSAFLTSLVQISSFSGLLKAIPQLPTFMQGDMFVPFGNLLNSTLFIASALPFCVFKIIDTNSIKQRVLSTIISFFLIINLFISIYLMLPGKTTSFQQLDLKSSWSIAVDSLKQNIFGVGAGNYTSAYLKFKPIEINMGDKWFAVYQQGTSFVFTVFTETGIIGLGLTVLIFLMLLKKPYFSKPSYISLIILAISTLALPYTHVLLPMILYIFAINSHTKNKAWEFKYARFLTIPFFVLIIFIGYLFGTIFYADILFFKSVSSALKNNGKAAYEYLSKTISINPKVDTYHLVMAEIDLNLAQTLSQKETLDEKDKGDIAKLVQQSVNEGKAAVKINSKKASNWEGLGNIYQTIIPYTKGAENFAIQSYKQAIFLNPLNPQLRLKLGGIYYNLGKYEEAIDAFKLAVLAKNNYANAHYNLAAAYRENRQTDKAIEEMEKVLTLVIKDSADYQKAQSELTALRQKKDQPESENTQNLSLPQTIEESTDIPSVEIPPVQ